MSVTLDQLTRAITTLKVTDHSLPGKPKTKPADPPKRSRPASS